MSVPAVLSADELRRCLAVRDLTDPAAGPHAMQSIVRLVVDAVLRRLPGALRMERGDRVVPVADNYLRLGYAAGAVTMDARYTRYVDAGHVLRSHTSAMVPPALRALAGTAPPPAAVLLACPGLCYRRDSVDWQHTGTPHQLDVWPLSSTRGLGEADLHELIDAVVGAALPGAAWRAVDSMHPYTERGRQVDVRWRGSWVEVGECGLASPRVLAAAGLAVPPWSGLAMGVGLDRLLMLRKGIPDIRLLRSADPRVAGQLLDLAPYRPVSHQPPVRRDLSIVVSAHTDATAEALGDRVRAALGGDADTAEHVEVLADTGYGELPAAAVRRLGLRPGQRNVLVRLVLRPLDRTLTDHQANVLRDRVYAALHEGAVHEWATDR